MAEFGVQATNLSPPQGAGSQPVDPVQEKFVDTSPISSTAVGGIVDIFAKGLQINRKEEAEKAKNAVIGAYVKEETAINNAVATGQLNPAAAASRSRANANKYYAGFPQYINDFESAGKALRGFTEAGEVQEQLQSEAKIRQADIQAASTAGFTFTPTMSKPAQDAIIQAHKTNVRAQQELEQMYKANSEMRAQGTYNAAVAERDAKEMGIRVINDVAGANMSAFQALGSTLVGDVKAGKTTPEQAQMLLTERFSNINGAIVSAARLHPELAAPYRTLFNEANDVYKKMLDPKNVTEGLENELKAVQTRLKLVAMSNPQFAGIVTTSNLLGNNPNLTFIASSATNEAVARIANSPAAQGIASQYVPQVVGNPDVEPGTLGILRSGLQQLKDPATRNVDKQKIEAENSVNEILKQTGQQLALGASPDKLKGVAQFFASPEYAGFVTSGKLNPENAQAAKMTFQQLYEPTVIQGVQQKLQNVLLQPTDVGGTTRGVLENIRSNVRPEDAIGRSPNAPEPTTQKPTLLKDALNVTFSGAGVQFEMKNVSALSDVERIDQRRKVTELQTAQKALNQIIHIGAHMEGSTDYAKYWEANKHIYLPQMFSKYKGLEIGDVKSGMRYKGGEANDPKNWEAVNGGGD